MNKRNLVTETVQFPKRRLKKSKTVDSAQNIATFIATTTARNIWVWFNVLSTYSGTWWEMLHAWQ
jgi:hypothetical protein